MVAAMALPAKAECEQVIKDCNIALNKCDVVIKGKDEVIAKQSSALKDCEKQTEILSVDLQKAQAGRDAWYRQPVTVGATAAAIVVVVLALTGHLK